jgi:predicted MFS family arabinose efflux permease
LLLLIDQSHAYLGAVAATTVPEARGTQRFLIASLMFIALVVAVVGSLGAPLITSVSAVYRVPLSSAQWTLTITLLAGAIATPVLGRLGSGRWRRAVIRWALVIIVAGSVATVLPLPFGWLLAGRAAQGTALGLTALMMGVARDHVPGARSGPVIAMLSVASTVGIGLGYPLAGLLTDAGGLRAAYGLGLFITVLALLAACRAIPPSPPGRPGDLDVPGAVLLGAGLLALLIPVSQSGLWTSAPLVAALLLAVAAALLAGWAWWENRAAAPLTDLRLLRHPAVAGANLAMFAGGIGMYLLLTLVTRYVQTPAGTGYGFGFSVFVAGLVLVPFSALGFAGGRLAPALRRRVPLTVILAAGAAVVLAALLMFALARSRAWESFVVMGALGLGVGTFSAAMPGVILAVTPPGETSSAMSFNQVVRSVGFSVGSALSALILSAYTPHGRAFPEAGGYGTAAWAGVAVMAVTLTVIAGLALAQRRPEIGRKPGRPTGYAPGASRS